MGDLARELGVAVERRDLSIFTTSTSPVGKAMVHPDSIRTGLIESGARRRLADELKADATIDLAAWCRAAVEAGLTKVEISRLSGASRPAIDAWLASEQ